mmetsp:Transcript_12269/g.19954  ORF Transcript_12269/g.19954 Transcript_12269/m.19954 type:complete len:88 (-) Transcript_12269:1468-1731(-)
MCLYSTARVVVNQRNAILGYCCFDPTRDSTPRAALTQCMPVVAQEALVCASLGRPTWPRSMPTSKPAVTVISVTTVPDILARSMLSF